MERRVKNLLILFLKVLVSGGALLLVIRKTGLRSLGEYLSGVNPYYFFVASGLYILSIYVSSIRWKILLWKSEGISVNYLFVLYITGSFFSIILPGIIGGDALRVYYLHRKGVNLSESFGSIFLDRYTGYAGLLITAFVGVVAGSVKREILAVLLLLTVLFVISTFVFLKFRFGRRVLKLERFYDYLKEFFSKPVVFWVSTGLSIVVQILVIMSVYSIMKATGVSLSLWLLFAYFTLIVTATMIPLSISGIGIREWSFVMLLGLSGIPAEAATAVSLLWFLSFVTGSLPGAVGYILLRGEK